MIIPIAIELPLEEYDHSYSNGTSMGRIVLLEEYDHSDGNGPSIGKI